MVLRGRVAVAEVCRIVVVMCGGLQCCGGRLSCLLLGRSGVGEESMEFDGLMVMVGIESAVLRWDDSSAIGASVVVYCSDLRCSSMAVAEALVEEAAEDGIRAARREQVLLLSLVLV